MSITVDFKDILKALGEKKCFVPVSSDDLADILQQAKDHIINEISDHIVSLSKPETKVVKSVRKTPEPVKKQVAARQCWKCHSCNEMLQSSFQVDHTIPLWAGGEDDESNLTALCANCHSIKTQNEAIERRKRFNSKRGNNSDMDDLLTKMKRTKVDKTLFFEEFRFRPMNFKI